MKLSSTFLSSALVLCLGASEAHATAWEDDSGDFNSGGNIEINSTDDTNATVIRKVSVTCPKTGRLVAIATAEFSLEDNEPIGEATGDFGVKFSIQAKNAAPIQHSQSTITRIYWLHGGPSESDFRFERLPGTVQRLQGCNAGTTHTFWFVATKYTSPSEDTGEETDIVFAVNPKLSVMFFDTKI